MSHDLRLQMSKMTRYTEAKSVKVDNWGVFFLQKLQNFFNKTDHCDLTLQFNDNSQLKVHRLVLSACTDYFNHLENVCEMYDDVLIMPMDLQADVIVPIVNFMYTGTLEFQYNMYERLLKTATDMNMTVLLKLLEAHRQTSRIAKQPILLNKQAPRPVQRPVPVNMFPAGAQRNTPSTRGRPRQTMMRHAIPSHPTNKSITLTDPSAVVSKYSHTKDMKPGPSRFDDTDMTDGFEGSFDTISYESKPLLTADQVKKEEEASPFEKLRKGYTNVNVVKRASSGSVTSPPAKKPNLDEVKEFTEAARLRSQLTTDDDDSPDYVDDDTHFNDDDDEDYQPPASVKAALAKSANQHGNKQVSIKQEGKSSGHSGMSVKHLSLDEDDSVDHAKIITEVLKKYPHLVKKNKNIKLKIVQKGGSPGTAGVTASSVGKGNTTAKMEIRTATPLKQDMSMVRKATANIRSEPPKPPAAASSSGPPKPTSGNPPRTIDAKTMHALIAKGAENMTGPWLCLRCGINGRPISIPSYRSFRNHLIVKHKERIDPRICEHCGWRAEQRNPNLLYHWYTAHNIKPAIKFPTCLECGHVAMDNVELQKHEEEQHSQGELQQCIYCNKVFAKEMELYDHMKEQHKQRAIADGVLDFTDDEYQEEDEEGLSPHPKPSSSSGGDGKIKILSNITLPPAKGNALPFVMDGTVTRIGGAGKAETAPLQQITLEPSSEAEALSNVASGIAASLGLVGDNGAVMDDSNYQNQFIEAQLASVHGESATTVGGGNIITKLVTEDGTELQLTQSQKDEIISQLQNPTGNNVVMVLNEDNFAGATTLQLRDGVQIVNTASTEDQNLMLMYNQDSGSANNDGQKSEAKPDVTASEDETSQASGALSEDKTATTDDKRSPDDDTQMEEGDESQDSRKTDATDKEQVEHGDDDVDMPGEVTSETNKTSQQAINRENDESNSADGKILDESEERHKSDKLKLISELEGDWSEDTIDDQAAAAATPPTAKKVPVVSADKSTKKTDGGKKAPAALAPTAKKVASAATAGKKTSEQMDKKKQTSDAEGKDIEKLLHDWDNDTRLEDSDTEEDLEKKMEKVTGSPPAESALDSSGNQNETVAKKEDNEGQKSDDAKPKAKSDDAKPKAKAEKVESTDVEVKSEKDTKSVEGGNSSPKVKKNGTTSNAGEVKLEPSDQEEAVGDDNDDDDEDKDKTASKSKEVNSLLGDWDEDDDL